MSDKISKDERVTPSQLSVSGATPTVRSRDAFINHTASTVEEPPGHVTNSKSLTSRRKTYSHKSTGSFRVSEFDEAIVDEIKKQGLSPELQPALSEIYRTANQKLTSPPIPSNLLPYVGRLLVRAAALAFQNASKAQQGSIPLFVERDQNIFPTAESFLLHAYAGKLGSQGTLDQAQIRKIDPTLMAQLDIEFRGEKRRAELRAIVPTAADKNDQRLKAALGYVPEGQERRVALNALARGYKPKPRR